MSELSKTILSGFVVIFFLIFMAWIYRGEQKKHRKKIQQLHERVLFSKDIQQSRKEVYESVLKLKGLFQSEAKKEDPDFTLEEITNARDIIMLKYQWYFNKRCQWLYFQDKKSPFIFQGPNCELNKDIEKFPYETVEKIKKNIGYYRQNSLVQDSIYQDIKELKKYAHLDEFTLSDLVYVRNEILTNHKQYFRFRYKTLWKESRDSLTLLGPYDLSGNTIE